MAPKQRFFAKVSRDERFRSLWNVDVIDTQGNQSRRVASESTEAGAIKAAAREEAWLNR